MKNFRPTLFLGLFAILLLSSKCKKGPDFSTPEALFETLVAAIKSKDLETYKKCWHPDRLEREGAYSKLQNEPGMWEELQGIFKGPQKIAEKDMNRDGTSCGMQIEAPEADGGGIGGLRMVKVGNEWKMKNW